MLLWVTRVFCVVVKVSWVVLGGYRWFPGGCYAVMGY